MYRGKLYCTENEMHGQNAEKQSKEVKLKKSSKNWKWIAWTIQMMERLFFFLVCCEFEKIFFVFFLFFVSARVCDSLCPQSSNQPTLTLYELACEKILNSHQSAKYGILSLLAFAKFLKRNEVLVVSLQHCVFPSTVCYDFLDSVFFRRVLC